MAQKNAVYQVDNGSGFDEIHFRTSENMLVNQLQNLSPIGFRKLPGGFIIQWGNQSSSITNNSYLDQKLYFPIEFPNRCVACFAAIDTAAGEGWGVADTIPLHATAYEAGGCTIRGKCFESTTTRSCAFKWIAIGY